MGKFFKYSEKKLQETPCDLCGSGSYFVLAKKAKGNLSTKTCLCKNCGMIFLNPRMSKGDYDDYYKNFYRFHRAELKGKGVGEDEGVEANFNGAKKFGKAWAGEYGKLMLSGLTVDVGSSTGGILYGLREARLDIEILGIEPSLAESQYAEKMGIKTINCLFEDYKGELGRPVSNIFCVQSLNHLLSPSKFLEWSRDNLGEGGRLFLAVKDFGFQCRRSGSIESSVQIDHPYMFTPESLKLFVESRGFKILRMEVDETKTHREINNQKKNGLNTHHIKIIAEKAPLAGKKLDLAAIGRRIYRKQRFLFSGLVLRAYYILFYSRFSPANIWRKNEKNERNRK